MSVARRRGSWVVGIGRGSWVWVEIVGNDKVSQDFMKCQLNVNLGRLRVVYMREGRVRRRIEGSIVDVLSPQSLVVTGLTQGSKKTGRGD